MRTCPHCLSPLEADAKGAPRSLEQLRRYFALMRAVYFHWPESHEHQFSNVEECRKYLQMKAGHREIGASIPLSGMKPEKAMFLAEAAIRAAGSYALPVIHGSTLIVFVPKSIAFHKMGHAEFCGLNREIDEVIREETGLDPEQVLNEHREMV